MPKRTTADFIAKAREVHGDRYDYSKVKYKRCDLRVTIVCPIHGKFQQRPTDHQQGSGCQKCSLAERTGTKETFVQKARAEHGSKFDYSKVKYVRSFKKVIITCPKHGDFKQTPSQHLLTTGCPECGKLQQIKSNTKTTAEFIVDAIEKHGRKYDYSLVEYINDREDVIIICPTHGKFSQQASSHLQGHGCSSCAGVKRKTTAEFINEAKKLYGETYSYEKTNYINAYTDVKIICSKHGEFTQAARLHLRGHGCRKCSGLMRKTTEEFIAEATEVHGNRYSYEKANYINSHTDVKIICSDHGVFEQTPTNHVRLGCGCPVCFRRGNSKTSVYLIKVKLNGEEFFKIGITSYSLNSRFYRTRLKYKKFSFRKVNTITLDHPNDAQELEDELHDTLDEYQFIPSIRFGGWTECFHLDHRKHILTAFRAAKEKYEG